MYSPGCRQQPSWGCSGSASACAPNNPLCCILSSHAYEINYIISTIFEHFDFAISNTFFFPMVGICFAFCCLKCKRHSQYKCYRKLSYLKNTYNRLFRLFKYLNSSSVLRSYIFFLSSVTILMIQMYRNTVCKLRIFVLSQSFL